MLPGTAGGYEECGGLEGGRYGIRFGIVTA
jgi:hypothetical protein